MTAQSVEVRVEVHPGMSSESEAVDMGQDQTTVTPRMNLGTQVGDDIPCPEHILSQDSGEVLCLEINLSVPSGEIVSQLRTQIQLACDPVMGGAGLEPLSNKDEAMFAQLVAKVGLLNLPQLQPKQVSVTGVHELVSMLQGTQLCLI